MSCTQETRRAYRELLYTAPIGEAGVSGAIMFKETLYQSAADGTPFVECLSRQGVLSGIKVDEVRLLPALCSITVHVLFYCRTALKLCHRS